MTELNNFKKGAGIIGGYIVYNFLLAGLNKFYEGDVPLQIGMCILAPLTLTPSIMAGHDEYKKFQRKKEIKKIRKGKREEREKRLEFKVISD